MERQYGIDYQKIQEFINLNESLHRLITNYLIKNLNSTLSVPQIFLLHILQKNGTCTPSNIAQIMGVTSGAITSLTDRLHKQGLIIRERNENDRRVVMISLTDPGKELSQKLEQASIKHLATIFDKLPAEDIDNLINIFHRLRDVVNGMDKTN